MGKVLFGKGKLGSALQKFLSFDAVFDSKNYGEARNHEFEIAYLAIPSNALQEVAEILNEKEAIAVIFSKGFAGSKLPHELFNKPVVAYGASFADEIGEKHTYLAIGGEEELRKRVKNDLSRIPRLKVYESDDITGLEVGAVLSKVYSIALGALEAFGASFNEKGLAFQQALVEMKEISTLFGGGDGYLLMAGDLHMCSLQGNKSRNYEYGRLLPQGIEIIALTEGKNSAKVLVEEYGIRLPLLNFVYSLVTGKSPKKAYAELLNSLQ